MTIEYKLSTQREEFVNITRDVAEVVTRSGVKSGLCVVFCPHTTAGITINENADPDVPRDILLGLDKAFPNCSEFLHAEGNSAAHLKASCVGSSATILIEGSRLLLGTWQGVWFCEFDGPRERKFQVKVIGN